ncbi:hypothetical protein FB45DRAFT_758155 [Roridomyces roridus]|uniref:Uncharacterized protein n=1 Tax=Roridomyces roridus TaxID=1738132 RepID=A0AAD7B9Z3_9AGAR|nr:hypothetical protein FB45DRAFT_758155 [Roridomyces roridus]
MEDIRTIELRVITVGDHIFYGVSPDADDESRPLILLNHAATVLQVIRTQHGTDISSIIRDLIRLGVEFHPAWRRKNYTYLSPPPTYNLGRRPKGYIPTSVDLGVYVQRRNAFLRTPRGHAALFHGGIIGRLARLVLIDAEDLALLEPSDDVLRSGTCVCRLNGGSSLWHQSLSPDEIKLICGFYAVETGKSSPLKYISWWPTPMAFESSGLSTGWWNANCERWFVKRLKEMAQGTAKLWTFSEWKRKIKFSVTARKVASKNEEIAAEYLKLPA